MIVSPRSNWTPYADLNPLLEDFVAGVQAVLRENLCGAYLQGSFAVGGADEHSDVDFIVVTNSELSAAAETPSARAW